VQALGALKYFHPYLAYRDIDWDAALVATLPKVEAARTADEFASAVESLTAVLEDPATRVLRPSATTQQSANADVTNFYVPGGIVTSFSGQAVRHADGRQLQRKGLVPDVPVTPTIKGIQTGRDEVLDAAVKYLERELAGKREK
jgi:C-terminal processing protease CtpA/Prc